MLPPWLLLKRHLLFWLRGLYHLLVRTAKSLVLDDPTLVEVALLPRRLGKLHHKISLPSRQRKVDCIKCFGPMRRIFTGSINDKFRRHQARRSAISPLQGDQKGYSCSPKWWRKKRKIIISDLKFNKFTLPRRGWLLVEKRVSGSQKCLSCEISDRTLLARK